MNPADILRQILACQREDGPCDVGEDPSDERDPWLSGWSSDRRAEAAENAQERSWEAFQR